MAKYIYRSSERLDRKHKSPRSGHSECWQPSMGGVSTPSSHSCSHLAFLHLQVIISGHGKTNFQLPFTRNEEPLHTAACLPACLCMIRQQKREGLWNRGRLVHWLFRWALQMGIAASEVFLTPCQQLHCRFFCHLQTQSHPFRERKNNEIKIRVFLLQPNPQALWLFDTQLSERAPPALSPPRSIWTWHLYRIKGEVSSGGSGNLKLCLLEPCLWIQADVCVPFPYSQAHSRSPGMRPYPWELHSLRRLHTTSSSALSLLWRGRMWTSWERSPSPAQSCGRPLISSHQTVLLCELGFFMFFFFLIWHTWKLVLYYRFPAFISFNYKISWEKGRDSMKCQRKE